MDKLYFSVLVPVYNTEKYLSDCIGSVINQTYSNWELILIDDGSTDKSGLICDFFSQKDKRIKTFHKINEGLISARQYARLEASGDFFIYLDSDDFLKPEALYVINKIINKTNSDCVIYRYEQSSIRKSLQKKNSEYTAVFTNINKRELYKKVFQNSVYNSLCIKAVRSRIQKSTDYSNYYKIQYGEDLLQSLEIYKKCNKITFIPDILYIYNMNPTSMTHTHKKKETLVDFTVRKQVLQFLQDENVFTMQDFMDYRDFCLKLLEYKILEIAVYPMRSEEKKFFFDSIIEDSYYKSFLYGNNMKYLGCTMLRDGKYNELILFANLRHKLTDMKNILLR